MAVTYTELGRYSEALRLEERALAIAEAAFGPDHPSTAVALGNTAATYGDLDRHADAVVLLERALVITETALGADHPNAVWIRRSIAAARRAVTGSDVSELPA